VSRLVWGEGWCSGEIEPIELLDYNWKVFRETKLKKGSTRENLILWGDKPPPEYCTN
jgi:hypothetical protein